MVRALLTLIICAAAPFPLSAQFESVDRAIQAGVTRGVYPGATVVIGTSSRILFARGYGHFSWNERSAVPSADSTLWDIASLTKVVATTAAIALLVDQGKVALDAPVTRYLPRFTGGERSRVTVRMLLEHTSGLPAGLAPAQRRVGHDSLVTIIYHTPLRRAPGSAEQYSDLNAILLGLIIEQVTGRPLDLFAAEAVFAPLGMTSTRFLPPPTLRARIAPTAQWRGTPLSGEVNDRTAGWLGGVAGHAGVFASASDLARYAQWWLRRGTLPSGVAALRPATMDTFLFVGPVPHGRLLGWESRTTTEYTPSPYGTLPSPRAYGHTGY
ncbi:MAG TPA: serine hydrolase domain-containing protein, partial [Gemmatimonadales bacterium]|nr:serine hydrolase domain-containing protein [Gemmatimonadales bacterium]